MTESENQPSLTCPVSITGGTAMNHTLGRIRRSMILVLAPVMFLVPARAAEDFAVTIPSRFMLGYDAGLPLGANRRRPWRMTHAHGITSPTSMIAAIPSLEFLPCLARPMSRSRRCSSSTEWATPRIATTCGKASTALSNWATP